MASPPQLRLGDTADTSTSAHSLSQIVETTAITRSPYERLPAELKLEILATAPDGPHLARGGEPGQPAPLRPLPLRPRGARPDGLVGNVPGPPPPPAGYPLPGFTIRAFWTSTSGLCATCCGATYAGSER
ncbi:hypothetical protein PG994_009607 [Apiospora phragmitis]|uniref:Uncharacterized protein n=1 Tax=Apiospora phragmitis TaxID=2905665 RepID=A0ABR1U6J6_9PEZI